MTSLAWSRDGIWLFSGTDKAITLWNVSGGKNAQQLYGHSDKIQTLSASRTLNLLASGGADSTVRIWDLNTRAQLQLLQAHAYCVEQV